MSEHPTHVLVVGATGSIGRHVVTTLQRHGLGVRALVRDQRRGRSLLPEVELVEGDLERPDTLGSVVEGVDGVIFTHGSDRGGTAERVDYGGVRNVLRALGGRRPRIALMTSIYVTRAEGAYADLVGWKRRSELLVRASGAPYTIVRPGWFDHTSPGDDRLVLEQGDTGDGGIGRAQLAEVLVRSLLTDTAVGRTFELFAAEGAAPSDWDGVFAGLSADTPGALSGARDTGVPDPDREPETVRADIAELLSRADG
ncbi:SDR family oxidoreductase [Nocardiopsis synnemataformans]|uniref:SDR family oxidoreductase n=1 Tax=Nocardiopsis synnemataformans TaxID=61305 RepID=UPI003EC022A0